MATYDDRMTIEDRLQIVSRLVATLRVNDYRIRITEWHPMRFNIIAEDGTRGLHDTAPYPQYTDDLVFTNQIFNLSPTVPYREDTRVHGSQGFVPNFGVGLSDQGFVAVQQQALKSCRQHRKKLSKDGNCLRRKGLSKKRGAKAMITIRSWKKSLLEVYTRLLAGRHGDRHCTRVKRVVMSIYKDLKASIKLIRVSGGRKFKSFAILEKACYDVARLARRGMRELHKDSFVPDHQVVAKLVSARDALTRTIQTISRHLKNPNVGDQASDSEDSESVYGD